MKTFLVILTLTIVAIYAEPYGSELLRLLDEEERRDLNSPLIKCENERDECFKTAGGDFKAELACTVTYNQCMLGHRPTMPPPVPTSKPTLPPYLVKCEKEKNSCLKDLTDIGKRLVCLMNYRECTTGSMGPL